jgi:hypothetical protein
VESIAQPRCCKLLVAAAIFPSLITAVTQCTSVAVLEDNQVPVKVGRRRAGRDIKLVPVMRFPS